MNHPLVSADLCKLMHDLQGHVVYTVSNEKIKEPKFVKASFGTIHKWQHGGCCGPFYPMYLVRVQDWDYYDNPMSRMSFIFWTQLLGWNNAHARLLKNVEIPYIKQKMKESMPLIQSDGIKLLFSTPSAGFTKTPVEPIKIYDGCIGTYHHPLSNEIKSVRRAHAKTYATPVLIAPKIEYRIDIWGSVIPRIPDWPVNQTEEDFDGEIYSQQSYFEEWYDSAQGDFFDNQTAPEQFYPKKLGMNGMQYNNKSLYTINLAHLEHNQLDCSICEVETPMFQESEKGAIRLLKSVGMG